MRHYFGEKSVGRMDVPPDLLGVYVPSLALQPLVENAIKHGISVDSAAGRLEIAAQRNNGRVSLRVRDDGPGLAPGSRLRFGVGLTNVQSRLKQLYGEESSLELTRGDGRGCEAIITIPLRSSHGGHRGYPLRSGAAALMASHPRRIQRMRTNQEHSLNRLCVKQSPRVETVILE